LRASIKTITLELETFKKKEKQLGLVDRMEEVNVQLQKDLEDSHNNHIQLENEILSLNKIVDQLNYSTQKMKLEHEKELFAMTKQYECLNK